MISVLQPTRQRADMWFENIKKASSRAKTNPEFLVYVDNDDPQLNQYKEHAKKLKDVDLRMIIDVPRRSAKAMRYLAFEAKHEYMIFGTDDLDWKTDGWDEKLIAKMPAHGLGVVFPATVAGNKIKARVPFFTKKWRDLTGLFPDDFIHFGPDDYVVRIAQHAGQEILAYDIEILHSKLNDVTSRRAREKGKVVDVKNKIPEIVEIANKVKAEINKS